MFLVICVPLQQQKQQTQKHLEAADAAAETETKRFQRPLQRIYHGVNQCIFMRSTFMLLIAP